MVKVVTILSFLVSWISSLILFPYNYPYSSRYCKIGDFLNNTLLEISAWPQKLHEILSLKAISKKLFKR